MALSTKARARLIVSMAHRVLATEVGDAVDLVTACTPVALADPGTTKAIPVDASYTINMTTGASGETNTLAIPTFIGQELVLNIDTFGGGSRVITSAAALNQAGNTVMTFGAARDTCLLKAIKIGGALRWQIYGNDGVALS